MNRDFEAVIRGAKRIVFFGGAGVSTASGIPDFRSARGIYSGRDRLDVPPETILSHEFFFNRTADFWRFYREKMLFPDAKPNAAHVALANLERASKLADVVTQNIDGLHQRAGSKNVDELHGSVLRNHCTKCGKFFALADILRAKSTVPRCDVCGAIIKPDVVLYGEPLDQKVMNHAVAEIARADTLIVGGTSLVVYPAAGLVDFFRGENLVLVNRDETPADRRATLVIHDDIAKVFGALDQSVIK